MALTDLNYKKVAIIVGFLILAGVIGYFIYNLFFRATIAPTPEQTATEGGVGSGLPEAGLGEQTPVTEEEGQLPSSSGLTGQTGQSTETAATDATTDLGITAFDPKLDANGQIQFYNQADSRFYKLDANGQLVAMTDKQFFNASNITWAPTNDKAVIEFPDGSKIRYNFNTQEQVTLPKYWEDFAFSPSGDKIVAKSMGVDPDNRWLVVANDDGSKAQALEPLGENGASVINSWSPNNQSVAMYVKGIDFNRKEVYFIGQNKENFKTLTTEGRGFEPKWSPDGHELLYSVYSADNDYKPTLWLVGAEGDDIGSNRRPLGLNTWANKCSYGGGSLYCAVPQTLERGAGLFPSLANNTPDTLYRINPTTGTKEPINLGSAAYTMKNISISPDGRYLYFTDVSTNRLRQIKLK